MIARRKFISAVGLAGAGLVLGARRGEDEAREVTAVEDLMREHGVLRRALFIYSETAAMIKAGTSAVPAVPVHRTAVLFRSFGEEYHEKRLEEAAIFPAVKKAGGAAARYPDLLAQQHARGREITGYLLSATAAGKTLSAANGGLAAALESFVRMYRPHAAIEDTVVFPAWKDALSARDLDAMNDRFEDIEHDAFGADGFGDAVREIASIEAALGLADLGRFTALKPPAG